MTLALCMTMLALMPYVLPGWLVDPYPLGLVYWKTWNLCGKFQFMGNSKVIQDFVTIVGLHFKWLEVHVKLHGIAGK